MASLTRFVEGRLKLQINTEKSAVARPWHRSFLGFTVKDDPAFRRCIADKAVTRFKDRVRELTRRHRGVSLEGMIADLNPFVRGWAGYFGFSQWHELPSLDGWIRRRLRCVAWVQWKTRGQRYRELRRLKVPERSASAGHFQSKGTLAAELLGSFAPRFHQSPFPSSGPASDGEADGCLIRRTTVVRTRMPGGVGGAASRDVPLSRLTERARCYTCPGGTAPRQCSAELLPRFFRLVIGGRSASSSAESSCEPYFLDK